MTTQKAVNNVFGFGNGHVFRYGLEAGAGPTGESILIGANKRDGEWSRTTRLGLKVLWCGPTDTTLRPSHTALLTDSKSNVLSFFGLFSGSCPRCCVSRYNQKSCLVLSIELIFPGLHQLIEHENSFRREFKRAPINAEII